MGMTDLTRGPISRHILGMAAFLAAGLLFQSAYFLVDLYFVARIGKQAVAGVGSAGNFFYLALSAAQLVGVGSVSLISQAIGRRDEAYARLVFNQCPDSEVRCLKKRSESGHYLFVFSGLLIPYVRREERRTSGAGH
jgi:Na+-driven multidrug efflux pump